MPHKTLLRFYEIPRNATVIKSWVLCKSPLALVLSKDSPFTRFCNNAGDIISAPNETFKTFFEYQTFIVNALIGKCREAKKYYVITLYQYI